MSLDDAQVRGTRLAGRRLVELLEKLSAQGISQSGVAARAGVPAQYLSDVVHARRPLTELFARRLAEEFKFNYRWLLGLEDLLERPGAATAPPPGGSVWLPVFPHPVEGEPRANPKWDGTCVEVPSIAAGKLTGAVHPYVLRFGHDDQGGRLKKGDLVLISQSPSTTAELSVVRVRNKCFLARCKKGKWFRAATGGELRGECVVAGHCVGILWSALAR